jgi:hypothetical protein
VLAGKIIAFLDRALFGVATITLQKQLHSLTPAETANGTCITSQIKPPQVHNAPLDAARGVGAVYNRRRRAAIFILLTSAFVPERQ